MGIYVFDADVLIEALNKDAADDGSRHSIGSDIIPMLVRERAAHVYDIGQNEVPGADARDGGYWRDLGTLDAYFDAHMDLCAVHPCSTSTTTVADFDPGVRAAPGQVRA
jgi:glucose-1-phosphate adenylyltransferase